MGQDKWAGAVDTVGSRTLVNVLAQTKYRGVVTTCGFVGGFDLPGTVLPFIMRNVTLAGIDSVMRRNRFASAPGSAWPLTSIWQSSP